MQTVTREQLIAKAAEKLADGTVNRVFGWKRGEFAYDVTPALFRTAEELESDFVFGDFCGANFSKYLIAVFIVMMLNFFANRLWTYNDVK